MYPSSAQSQRWERGWLDSVKGTEIQPNPGEHDTRVRIRIDPKIAADVPVPTPKPSPPRTRSVRLKESDFWEAGFSEDCRGCELILEGSRQSRVHTAARREGMEEYLATATDGLRRQRSASASSSLRTGSGELGIPRWRIESVQLLSLAA